MCYGKAGKAFQPGKLKLQPNFPALELNAGSGFTVQPSRVKVFYPVLTLNPEP
jgi:hypothetical protein